jgi:hypothetical protein
MIIADLIHRDSGERLGRVYLADAPFPGDTLRTQDVEVMVINRTFLDLGPDAGSDNRLSLELRVRAA